MNKLLLVEDEFIIAKDIKLSLHVDGKLEVDIAQTYDEAMLMFSKNDYKVVISDINLNEDKDGIDLIEDFKKYSQVPVVFLTAYSDSDIIERAKKTIPFAYLLKPFDEVQLKVTIDLALLNFKKVFDQIDEVEKYTAQFEELTKRERQVLITLCSGKTVKEAGDTLNISPHTVEVHKKNIKKKLNMNTMTELINFALASKLYEV